MSVITAKSFVRRGLVLLAIPLLVLAAMSIPAVGDLEGPSDSDRQVTRVVTRLLLSEHLTQRALDDEVARRCIDEFLGSLDPWKLYFNQQDVDQFRTQQNELDDLARSADQRFIAFAYRVFDVYLERLQQSTQISNDFLAADLDFTVEEFIVTDPEKVTYPRSEEEARERWRKRVKYDLLDLKSDGLSDEEAREKLHKRYNSRLKRMQQTDGDELLERYLTSLTHAFDPHTDYMGPRTLEDFDIDMRLELDGIGAQLQFEDGYTVVKQVMPGGAAATDGRLKAQDQIVGVGQGEDGEIEDVIDMRLRDVVSKIRGKRGTVVRLQVLPAAGGERVVYNVTRARIEIKESEARGEILEEIRDGRAFRVGVIDLPSFYMDMRGFQLGFRDFKSTTRDVRRILDDFKQKQVDVVILDLRRNGGGSLREAINLTGLFIDTGPVVQIKDADGQVQQLDDLDEGTAWDGPLVCLTSKLSASASEIFAGAIQDYDRGLVVGDTTTFGKGTVQSLLDLGRQIIGIPNRMGALKITMQQFYRPNGESTQNRGVVADVALPSLISQLDIGEAGLDNALAFDQVEAAQFRRFNQVNDDLRRKLNALSTDRRTNSPDYQKLQQKIERFQQRKQRATVSLREETFLAERAELNAQREEEKVAEQLSGAQRPVVLRDFEFEEMLQITLDYLSLADLASLN